MNQAPWTKHQDVDQLKARVRDLEWKLRATHLSGLVLSVLFFLVGYALGARWR